MRTLAFHQVDVFGDLPLKGNALAVVVDANELSDTTMASLAKWTNLSETTFLLKPTLPGADYRVRIFTPAGELPFAGHPTLGSCQVWLNSKGKAEQSRIVQECGVGLVQLKRDGEARRSDLVHDGADVIHALFEGGDAERSIRQALSTLVESDDASERR